MAKQVPAPSQRQPTGAPAVGSPWYVTIGPDRLGPLDDEHLQDLAKRALLDEQTLVWREGMGGWDRARNVSELRGLLAQIRKPPMGNSWYVALSGERVGPMRGDQVMDLAQAGQLTPETLVWTKDMDDWTMAANVPEISELLDAMHSRASAEDQDGPPPLPSQVQSSGSGGRFRITPQDVDAYGSARPGSRAASTVPGVRRSGQIPERLRDSRLFGAVSSSAGVALAILFFLPWIRVSCNDQLVARPSGFNFAAGIPDAKTKGTVKMLEEMGQDSGEGGALNKGKPDGALALYAFLVLLVFLNGFSLLLGSGSGRTARRGFGTRSSGSGSVPVLRAVACAVLAALCILILCGFYLVKQPGEPPPPMVDYGFTLPFYLSGLLCLGLVALGVVGVNPILS